MPSLATNTPSRSKVQESHTAKLGLDARGNLTRIDNALNSMRGRLQSVQKELENLYNQQAAAKVEVQKLFM